MATVREWLEKNGFSWETGVVVFQQTEEGFSPGWSPVVEDGKILSKDDPILDKTFYSGYGGPECPRIFARDGDWIFFPGQYDGSTWLEKLNINPEYYLNKKNPTPYPGGKRNDSSHLRWSEV